MMARKRPKWHATTPNHVRHAYTTLRDAAAVIKADATAMRKNGKHYYPDARVMDRIADALLTVANGATWQKAFDLPQDSEPQLKGHEHG